MYGNTDMKVNSTVSFDTRQIRANTGENQAPIAPIPYELDRLEKGLQVLSDQIARLTERLAPVLVETKAALIGEDLGPASTCPLAHDVFQFANRIESMINRVSGIQDALQL